MKADTKIRRVTYSVIVELGKWYVVGCGVAFLINAASSYLEIGKDSTDGGTYSGMELHVDALTRCHYLSNPEGGLTPRMTKTGTQYCD